MNVLQKSLGVTVEASREALGPAIFADAGAKFWFSVKNKLCNQNSDALLSQVNDHRLAPAASRLECNSRH